MQEDHGQAIDWILAGPAGIAGTQEKQGSGGDWIPVRAQLKVTLTLGGEPQVVVTQGRSPSPARWALDDAAVLRRSRFESRSECPSQTIPGIGLVVVHGLIGWSTAVHHPGSPHRHGVILFSATARVGTWNRVAWRRCSSMPQRCPDWGSGHPRKSMTDARFDGGYRGRFSSGNLRDRNDPASHS